MDSMHGSLISLGCVFGFAPPIDSTLTALRALKIAKRRQRPDVRSILMSMESSRTDASLAPHAWRFTFLDPAASGRCRVVMVADKASSEHPDTVRAFSSIKMELINCLEPVAQNLLQVDSNQALERVRKESKLKGVQSLEYRLTQPADKGEPVWRLSFFAESPELLACFLVGAQTGRVSFV